MKENSKICLPDLTKQGITKVGGKEVYIVSLALVKYNPIKRGLCT